MIRGVDPRHEPDVADTREQVISGEGFEPSPDTPYPKVVLGYMLADRLGAFPGDTLTTTPEVASVSPLHGAIPAPEVRARGHVQERSLRVRFEVRIRLLDGPPGLPSDGTWHMASRLVDDAWDARAVGEEVVERLDGPYYITTWIELNQPLFSALKLEKKAMFVILVLIVLVAAFNIISTLTMIVMDKTKEIGILRSMGMKGRAIRRIFIYQGALIGGVGTLGCLAGLAAALLLARYRFISLPGEVYFIDTLPVSIEPLNIALIIGSSVAISLAATIYPARQRRHDAGDAIRRNSRAGWGVGLILEARRLHKEYAGATGPVKVLCGVDLTVDAGETVSIVGAGGREEHAPASAGRTRPPDTQM